jgi:D-alanyl-D-alanine carboxypeptidase/D-alanyl-D-alanine-endopeptidase (penicillin-binding protein 4)
MRRRVAFEAMRVKARRRLALGVAASVSLWLAAPAAADPTTTTARSTTTSSSTTTATPPTGTGHPATPILSVRRLPGWIEARDADQQIAAGLPGLMAKLGPAAKYSCLDVSQDGMTIDAVNATQEETPASNMKLLTVLAALDRFGPKYRIRTSVVRVGRLVRGVLHGNLYLVGGGDPLLRVPGYVPDEDLPETGTTSLPQLAAQVRAAGIKTVDGSVIGDGALFDDRTTVAGWSSDYTADDDVGPIAALDVNDGFNTNKPWTASAQPVQMTAQTFRALLTKDGIGVAQKIAGQGAVPRRHRKVTSILSAPLSTLVGTILKVSDDTGAEILTKLLGARFGGAGSTAAGVKVIKATLAADGLPVEALHAVDGSGLDTADQVSCQLVLAVLQRAGTGGAIFAGLPVAGQSGTLDDRMTGTAAQGRVHAKTGTLTTVSSLSGFVMPASGAKASTAQTGAPIAFSFISNNLPGDYLGIEISDDIAVYLAGVKTKLPPLSSASPLPDLP